MNYNQTHLLLSQLCQKIKENKKGLTNEASIVLSNMFPNILSQSLLILDQGRVTKFQCQDSGRSFYRVKEPASSQIEKRKSDQPHPHFDILQNFCHCQYTARECLSEKGSSVICKHVLASILGEAMQDQGLMELKMIEDNDFAPLLLSSKSHQQKYDQKVGGNNPINKAMIS